MMTGSILTCIFIDTNIQNYEYVSNAHPGRVVVRHEEVLIMAASRQIVGPRAGGTLCRRRKLRRVQATFCLSLSRWMSIRSCSNAMSRSSIPVLIDVWAPWCGPYHMMAPAFANAASMLEPDMRLVKLNSQDEPEMASQLRIRGVPTMLLFVNGREVARTSGAMNTSAIVAWAREQAVGYN